MPYKDPGIQDSYVRGYLTGYRRGLREGFLIGKTCVHCGSAESLELDHIDPDSKDPEIRAKSGGDYWTWPARRRDAELAKCQVLCHDCHGKKTTREAAGAGHGKGGRPILRPDVHDRNRYNRGCRCDDCCADHNRYNREWYARRKSPSPSRR